VNACQDWNDINSKYKADSVPLFYPVWYVFTAVGDPSWTAWCWRQTEGCSPTCESSSRCAESFNKCGFIWQPDSWP